MKKDIKKRVIFNFFFVLIVFVLFVGVEAVLRLADYGYPTEPFVRSKFIPSEYNDNVHFRYKYYHSVKTLKPALVSNVFSYRKEPGTLRGFVIGGSTAEGFPLTSNQCFSKILENALRNTGIYDRVEVINAGNSAMSSYYVADAAEKLISYKPDFLIVYSGHNEYYGTISYTSGGVHLFKKLNLKLKEYKLFQLLFNILNGIGKESGSKSLMAKQFANTAVPQNDVIDRAVAARFISNINEVVQLYSKNNIPVIIVEPVSNLVDMPPFSGGGDDAAKSFVAGYHKALIDKDITLAESFFSEASRNPKYRENANIAYLNALYASLRSKKYDIESLTVAKDLDRIPFRARSVLVKRLEEYCTGSPLFGNKLFYVPTQKLLIERNGTSAMGNSIFIDHLHFNFEGNRLLSEMLVAAVSKALSLNPSAYDPAMKYLSDTRRVRDDIHLLPLRELTSYYTIENLVSDSPYKEMLLPYRLADPSTQIPSPAFFADKELQKQLRQDFHVDPTFVRAYQRIVNYYATKSDTDLLTKYLLMPTHITPADPAAYIPIAKYSGKYLGNDAKANEYYTRAYLLSGRSIGIYDKMLNYYIGAGKRNQLDSITATHGKPDID